MKITVKNISIQTYQSIRLIKRYHGSLLQVYTIIIKDIPNIKRKLK